MVSGAAAGRRHGRPDASVCWIRSTRYFLDQEKKAVDGVMTVTGFAFSGRGQNVGMAFVRPEGLSASARRPSLRQR